MIVEKSQLVPYSAEQMFEMVDDVESYKLFLPWCKASEVLNIDGNDMFARIGIQKGGINESFSTVNNRKKGHYIRLKLVEGPFSSLSGEWRFFALDDHACKVSLRLEYEYSSGLIKRVFGMVFNHAANTMVKAFVKRAGEIYD